MKPLERRLDTLKKHIKQAEVYQKYKGKKARTESEEILFTAAKKYLTEHLNGHRLNLDAWRQELGAKTAETEMLYKEYCALKDETAKVEKIKKSIADILRSESPERQPKKKRGMAV
jgi:hypothetical protein